MNLIISNSGELKKNLELIDKNIGSLTQDTEANFSNWNKIVEGAKELSEDEREDICSVVIDNMMDNPNSLLFIFFIL